MKVLLDETLSPAIARALRAPGHDVVAVKERPEWVALSDHNLLAVARSEQRAIITANLRDFRPLHAELVVPGGSGHAGLVLVPASYRLAKAWTGRVVTAFEAKLEKLPGEQDLGNGEAWL